MLERNAYMTTFERIKKLAKQKDKNLQQVAKELGYGENYFYSLNAGKQPTAEKLQQIADYFGVSVDYLLGRTDTPDPNGSGVPLSWDDTIYIDPEEEDLLAAFRMESEEMTDEEKKKFNASLKGMMKIAKGLLNDDSKWKK